VDSGMVMRLQGKGASSEYNEEPGDLYVSLIINSHPEFERSGINIISEKCISYIDAILGTKTNINTIHGKVNMKISSGTQPDSILKIASKGIKTKQKIGDHLVKLKIELPKKVSNEEAKLLEKIREITNEKR
jgi:DnaJ-class molecular chaperone